MNNTVDSQMFFWSVFFKTHNKSYRIDHQKRHFGRFRQLITVFLCFFKNTDQHNICVSIVLKAETEKKNMNKKLVEPPKRAFLSFEIKTVKIFFFCFSFKNNRRTNVILIIIFENT